GMSEFFWILQQESRKLGWQVLTKEVLEPVEALYEVIRDADDRRRALTREAATFDQELLARYVSVIVADKPVPIANSPLTGSTISQLVAAGGGAGFLAAFAHPDFHHLVLYFAVLGGTRIVIGAADGISIALKQGLSQKLLDWMGVKEKRSSSSKK